MSLVLCILQSPQRPSSTSLCGARDEINLYNVEEEKNVYEFFQNIWRSLQGTGKESTTWFPVFLIYFSDLGFTLLVEAGGRGRMNRCVHFQGLWDSTLHSGKVRNYGSREMGVWNKLHTQIQIFGCDAWNQTACSSQEKADVTHRVLETFCFHKNKVAPNLNISIARDKRGTQNRYQCVVFRVH